MGSFDKLLAELGRIGAQWDDDGPTIDAPPGMVWNASACHIIAVPVEAGGLLRAWSYEAALSDVREGFVPCRNDECDYCAEMAGA